jgi:hypothetical protein
MSFIVETGAGITDANSYETVANYRSYWLDRGVDKTSETDAEIQGRLVRGTDYLDNSYRFQGVRTYDDTTNFLEFPRTGLEYYDSNVIPQPVKEFVILAADLLKSGNIEDQSKDVASRSVGPLSISFNGFAGNTGLNRIKKILKNKNLLESGVKRV